MILDISRFWSIVITTHWAYISDPFIFQIHHWFLCELLLIYFHMSMSRLVITFLLRCPRLAQTSTGSTIQVMANDENQVKFRFQHVPTGPQKVGGVPALYHFLRFWFIGLAQGGKKINIYQKLRYFMVKNHGFPRFSPRFSQQRPSFPRFWSMIGPPGGSDCAGPTPTSPGPYHLWPRAMEFGWESYPKENVNPIRYGHV